jgi:phage terminase large subunit-like protein
MMTRCGTELRNALLLCAAKRRLKQTLDRLDHNDLWFIEGDWPTWAHAAQLPPGGHKALQDWSSWLILGGRGSGKTRAGAEWVRSLIRSPSRPVRPLRIALVGPSYAEAREVMVEGVSGLMSLEWHDRRPELVSSRRLLVWPDGSQAHLFSAEDPEQLRGPQFDLAWCDGILQWPAIPIRRTTGCCSVASRWGMKTLTRQ